MRWFASIALSLILAATAQGAATDVQQGQDAATVTGTAMRTYAGTGKALSDNLVTPLMKAGTITSADGKTQFAANGFQTSGQPLIQITLNPNPATGDLHSIILQQDLTGAGTLNYAQTFPMPGDGPGQEIAAVCQNGYIQCTGNFSNCQYRAWTFVSTGAVSAKTASGGPPGSPGSVGGLAGCYCFNNYCTGQNSTLIELGVIGSDVGGGILSAFLAANTGMAISSASSGSNSAGSSVLTYYGYKPSTISKGSDTTTMTQAQIDVMPVMSSADTQTPQTYYSDSASLNNAAQNALTAQKAAPRSLYNIVTNAALSQSATSVTCTNSVQPSLSSITLMQSQSGSTQVSIDHSFTWSFVQVADNLFSFTGVDNKGLHMPNINYTFQPSDQLGGYALQTVSFVGSWPAANGCNGLSVSPTWTPSVGIGTQIAGASINGICPAGNYQTPVLNWTFTAQYVTQKESDVTSLGCTQYENNPDCTLQQDEWDDRPVVVNGLVMRNRQLGQTCKTLPGVGSLPAVTVCKEWFVQKRTFNCKNTSPGYDFTTAKAHAASIESSTSMPDRSSFRYTDPTQAGATRTYGIPTAADVTACNEVCETKVPVTQTGVLYTDTNQSAAQTTGAVSATQYLFYYKDCTSNTSGTWNCPADSATGEVVVTPCGCSADMGSVVGALNAAGSAAQDAICSAK